MGVADCVDLDRISGRVVDKIPEHPRLGRFRRRSRVG